MSARTPNTPTIEVQNEPPITPLAPSVDDEPDATAENDAAQATATADGGDD